MKHITQLLLKFVLVAVILEIILLWMTSLGFWQILLISLVVTLLAYVIGDMVILLHSSNTVATVCDLVLATIVIFLFSLGPGAYSTINFWNALICGILIAISEWFFHKYLLKKSEDTRRKDFSGLNIRRRG